MKTFDFRIWYRENLINEKEKIMEIDSTSKIYPPIKIS